MSRTLIAGGISESIYARTTAEEQERLRLLAERRVVSRQIERLEQRETEILVRLDELDAAVDQRAGLQ